MQFTFFLEHFKILVDSDPIYFVFKVPIKKNIIVKQRTNIHIYDKKYFSETLFYAEKVRDFSLQFPTI